LEEYRATGETIRAFNDFALASRIHATLFASATREGLAVEVRADCGRVHIRGRVEEGMEQQVVRVVENVPGVIQVTTDLYSAPPEGVLRI
jgi:osmotically-inducible protein OsmY